MTIWILLLLPDTCHRTGHIRMISTVLWQRSKKLTNPDCKEDQDRLPLYLYPSPMLFLSNTFWYTRYWYSSSTPSSSSILEFHWPGGVEAAEGVHGRVGSRRLKKEALIGIHGHSRRLQQQGDAESPGR